MARRAYLSLGANLGDRLRALREAVARLRAAPGVNSVRVSRVYETEPVGPVEQPRFLNLAVELELTDAVAPRDLLRLAKDIERELGRTPRERWGPREIDVDVLLVGEERLAESDLELPHPRMWERAFVMVPLAELVPDLAGPAGERAADIAARLRRQQRIHAAFPL